MKNIYLLAFVIYINAEVKADIAPNPIQARGISAKSPTEIKMTYEKVTVSLTLDSSFVHCYFKLHNVGKAEKIQIGYPCMNTTPYTLPKSSVAPINVFQNGKRIETINMATSDPMGLSTDKKSWYLWDSFFEENETMVIELTYSLPHGIIKNNLYYKFDYLLSTGSGWKGKIDTAEIIVKLENFEKSLILKTSPEGYTVSGNQLIWRLYNIEPSSKDDISIKYEKKAGQYDEKLKNSFPLYLLDEKIVLSNDIRHSNNLDSVNPNDIVYLKVIKDTLEAKSKFPIFNSHTGLILIYSKRFIPTRLIGILNSKTTGTKSETIKPIPISEFKDKYSLDLNGRNIKKEDIAVEILKINESIISQVFIKKLHKNKYHIIIRTNQ